MKRKPASLFAEYMEEAMGGSVQDLYDGMGEVLDDRAQAIREGGGEIARKLTVKEQAVDFFGELMDNHGTTVYIAPNQKDS